ncbi:hypothetical protein [Antiquaquibacter soli]|uniref:Uncharacterized protein n=1 Tax=Antiquaquibacter soli TaxID=3064523 RepID=A0ABT9BPX5_9MICO|nr:hypothetical protein [Protaetiibacter sp. WY-16]MDO7881352.1 hypothetical protein [Protaetiibacter sp. WY-16]
MDRDRLRSIASEIARQAVERLELDDPDVLRAVQSEPLPESDPLRATLFRVVERLDEVAWEIQSRIDEGTGTEAEYESAFTRARAAHALWFSLDPDPMVAAKESAYEAYSATDDLSWIEDLVGD